MSADGKYVDFEVVSEPWNVYEVNHDHAIIKTKYVVTKIMRKSKDGKNGYAIEGQVITVTLNITNQKGQPDNRAYSVEELRSSIIQDNLKYTTKDEEWNEYRIEDLTTVRLKTTITKVAKTSKFDVQGDPTYLIDNNLIMQLIPPPKPSI